MPSFQLCRAPVKIVKTDTIWPPTFQRQLGVTLQVVRTWLICSNRKLYHKRSFCYRDTTQQFTGQQIFGPVFFYFEFLVFLDVFWCAIPKMTLVFS